MTNLWGKIALVTGGSKGIGRATTRLLVKAGVHVVFTYGTDIDASERLMEELGRDKAIGIKSDAGVLDDIEKLVKTVVEEFGRIDVLIANAGCSPAIKLQQTTEVDFARTFDMNVKGPFFLAQKATPHMPPGSHIILVSSSLCATSQVPPDKLLYCCTKGAIDQMARVLAQDLGRYGIVVNAIAPGPTATEMFYKGKPEPVLRAIAESSPYKRIGTPEEIAEVILFLSGISSTWVAGQVLRVNGGSA